MEGDEPGGVPLPGEAVHVHQVVLLRGVVVAPAPAAAAVELGRLAEVAEGDLSGGKGERVESWSSLSNFIINFFGCATFDSPEKKQRSRYSPGSGSSQMSFTFFFFI